MPNVAVLSFNNGEVSPYIDPRADVEKYTSSCRALENMLPLIYGAAMRRPGTQLVAEADSSDIRVISFIYSADIAYVCEFGEKYIKFYYGGVPLMDGETQVEVESPYAAADLFQIHYRQIGDTMWLTHPQYPPMKLMRTSATSFELEEIEFRNGPFLTRNDLLDPDEPDPIQMQYSAGGAEQENYKTGDNDYSNVYGGYWSAQTFQTASAYTAGQVAFKAYRVGTTPGTVTVSIRACSTTDPATAKPTGPDLAVGYTSGNTLTTTSTGEWRTVNLETPVALSTGTMYALVIRALNGTASNYIRPRRNSAGAYANGTHSYSENSGAGWTIMAAYDLMFSIYSSAGIALTATKAVFDDDDLHLGALFKLTTTRTTTKSAGSYASGTGTGMLCEPIRVRKDFSFVTHGTWTGTVVLERSERGEPYEPYYTRRVEGDTNISLVRTEKSANVWYQAQLTEHTTGAISAEIAVDNPTQDTVFRITGVTSPTEAMVEVVSGPISTETTKRWAEGAWSDYRGYPKTVAFFEDRCCYAFTYHKPQTLWLSASGDYEEMEEGEEDDSAFIVPLTSTNDIEWIESLESLVVGTAGGLWVVESGKLSQPLTPTNATARQHSTYAAAPLPPMKANEAVLFVEKFGRNVREMVFDEARQKYASPDMTRFAEHITASGIINVALQANPNPIVWAVLDNGGLISLTYERDQDVVGWARHPMTSATVKSVCVIPGESSDEVWLVVERTVGEATVPCIERIVDWELDDIEDAYFVDSGIVASSIDVSEEESQKTGADASSDVYGAAWCAQTFTAGSDFDIRKVSIRAYRVSTPGTITVSLRACTTNNPATAVPTGSDLTSGTTNGDTLTTNTAGEWRAVTFDESVSLTSGTMYAIVVRATSGTASKYLKWQRDSSSPAYTNGASATSSNSGSAWTVVSGSDYLFITYSNPVVTGLDHLEGETVAALADGIVLNDATVAGGQAFLDRAEAITTASVGLRYRYKLQPMRLDVSTEGGASRGSFRKIAEMIVSLKDSAGVQYGRDDMKELRDLDKAVDDEGQATLFTGDVQVVFDGGFDPADPILITGDDPLPCTVRALIARTEVVGR